MSARNTLANKKKRREERAAKPKAVAFAKELPCFNCGHPVQVDLRDRRAFCERCRRKAAA